LRHSEQLLLTVTLQLCATKASRIKLAIPFLCVNARKLYTVSLVRLFSKEIFACVHHSLRGETHMQAAGGSLPLRPRYIKVCIRHWMMMVLCKYKKEAPPRTLGVTLGDQRPAAERGARASKRVSLSLALRCQWCSLLLPPPRQFNMRSPSNVQSIPLLLLLSLRCALENSPNSPTGALSARAARRSGYNLTNFTVSLRAASIFALKLCARIIPANAAAEIAAPVQLFLKPTLFRNKKCREFVNLAREKFQQSLIRVAKLFQSPSGQLLMSRRVKNELRGSRPKLSHHTASRAEINFPQLCALTKTREAQNIQIGVN
jgi:hypothetical protein